MAHGKKYVDARGSIDREKLYSPVEAVRKLKSMELAKFDETVEVHFRLGLNVRHADEQLRGTLMLRRAPSRSTSPRPSARRRPASSSTAPTAARTCTSRSARRASTSGPWSRTTRPSWTRSSARSRRRRRAATSGRSRSRARWARASTSTRLACAASSTSSRGPLHSRSKPTRTAGDRWQPPRKSGRSPAEVGHAGSLALSVLGPPPCGPSHFRRK